MQRILQLYGIDKIIRDLNISFTDNRSTDLCVCEMAAIVVCLVVRKPRTIGEHVICGTVVKQCLILLAENFRIDSSGN
jgi:hypothetical protein